MHIINIAVRDKIATYVGDTYYICGNKDYVVHFDLDAEWDGYETKTARFVYGGNIVDKVFEGNECPIPRISNVCVIEVGVFAGDLKTTTPAHVPAKKSILCSGGVPADPTPDVYNQIMERLNGLAPATTEPHHQLVTDRDGKMLWEEKLCWKESGVVEVFPETTFTPEDETAVREGVWYILKEFSLTVGKEYKVNFNGEEYTLTAGIAKDTQFACVGNAAWTGGGFSDIPFVVVCAPGADSIDSGVVNGMLMVVDESENPPTTVTLSITGEEETVKFIDPVYLGSVRGQKKITLTIEEDGTVTSDTDFATAWAMDTAELQAAITVKRYQETTSTKHIYEGAASFVTKRLLDMNDSGTCVCDITIRIREDIGVDPPFKPGDKTFYICWSSILTGEMVQGGKPWLMEFNDPGLPYISPEWDESKEHLFVRWNTNHWEHATIDQVKKDLGITGGGSSGGTTGGGVDFTTDETLTLENGILSVNTAENVEADNTLPVTSAAVFAEVGNINALLETI